MTRIQGRSPKKLHNCSHTARLLNADSLPHIFVFQCSLNSICHFVSCLLKTAMMQVKARVLLKRISTYIYIYTYHESHHFDDHGKSPSLLSSSNSPIHSSTPKKVLQPDPTAISTSEKTRENSWKLHIKPGNDHGYRSQLSNFGVVKLFGDHLPPGMLQSTNAQLAPEIHLAGPRIHQSKKGEISKFVASSFLENKFAPSP